MSEALIKCSWEDACAALNAEAHKASIGLFGRIGRVRSTEQVLNALAGNGVGHKGQERGIGRSAGGTQKS